MTAVCPTCQTTQRVTPEGTIARHQGTSMRWSGRRWFREQCAGAGSQAAPSGADGSEEA